ncbi:MAG: hypothetical protein WC748_00790 [Legionellales bacterium]|jgi:hypothetical protein
MNALSPDPRIVKKSKLIKYAESVLNDPFFEKDLAWLMKQLNLTRDQIINTYVNYDLDIFAFENEIYDSLAMPFVLHLHNLLTGSWHIERQNTVLKYLDQIDSKKIIEVGFGTPSLYVKRMLETKNTHMTLCDYGQSAISFAKSLLDSWDNNWHSSVLIKNINMEDGKFVGAFDTYIFLDSIEHVSDPTSYLITQVESAPVESNFILSIPIGPMIPSHFIEWKTNEDAVSWLDCCGLRVIISDMVHVNPEVDLFAEQLDYNLCNLFVLCEKNTYGKNLSKNISSVTATGCR